MARLALATEVADADSEQMDPAAGYTITVTMKDKTVYAYTVSDIKIYENTADFKLPATDGKTLVLATCYPFRYSGNAPGKYVVIGE